jgi:hypothetical protein
MMQTTGVFVPQGTDALFHFHFTKCNIANNITVYNDSEQFRNSWHSKKVACFQMPYPLDSAFNVTVQDLLVYCDHVLILMSELHDSTVGFITANDNTRISYFICGELNFSTVNSPVHKFYDWFSTTVHFYKYEQPQLIGNTLRPFDAKPKQFDALLGRKKHHRDIAFQYLNKEANVVTYLDSHDCDFSDPVRWRWESSGLVIDDPVLWTVDRVNYHGYSMSLSQIIPLEIYNETAYSLVAETNYSNHYSFYTEKTVKPILGQRLFIQLSGQYALKNLRAMGFRTFNDIIDESYDVVEGFADRCNMALEQVSYLTTQNQQDILEKIRPICEHNYNHIMRTDWYRQYFMPAFTQYFLQT